MSKVKILNFEVNGEINGDHKWLSMVTYRRLNKVVITAWYKFPKDFFDHIMDTDGITVDFVQINRINEVKKLIKKLRKKENKK